MGHFLNVKVLDKNSRIIVGAPVKVVIAGLLDGGETRETHTDSSGVASFTTHKDYEASRQIHIVVRGRTLGSFSIERGSYIVKIG